MLVKNNLFRDFLVTEMTYLGERFYSLTDVEDFDGEAATRLKIDKENAEVMTGESPEFVQQLFDETAAAKTNGCEYMRLGFKDLGKMKVLIAID